MEKMHRPRVLRIKGHPEKWEARRQTHTHTQIWKSIH